jgi:hypothetical protein
MIWIFFAACKSGVPEQAAQSSKEHDLFQKTLSEPGVIVTLREQSGRLKILLTLGQGVGKELMQRDIVLEMYDRDGGGIEVTNYAPADSGLPYVTLHGNDRTYFTVFWLATSQSVLPSRAVLRLKDKILEVEFPGGMAK